MILMRHRYYLFVVYLLSATLLAESQPTVDELMQVVLSQPVSTTNPAVKSYETEMDCMGVRANFWYQQPHRTALWVMDARDGTPVMAAADGTVAIYDTLRSTVLLITNQYAGLQFTSSYSKVPGKSGVNFCFNIQGNPREVNGEIKLPSKAGYRQFPATFKSLGGNLYELQGSDTRENPKTGESTAWTFRGVTDWPQGTVPYRSLEIRGGQFLNLTVKSVNERIPDTYLQFPAQALLTSGLPVRRLSSDSSQDMSRLIGFLMANLSIRHALSLGDPQKAKEALQGICKEFAKTDASRSVDKLYGDTKATEKMLAEMTEEQWESTRAQLFADLSPQEFAKRRQDPAFLKSLAEKIVAGMSKPIETNQGTGPTLKDTTKDMMASFEGISKQLDNLDIEALRAKDQKIASQLRQAFQLETVSSK